MSNKFPALRKTENGHFRYERVRRSKMTPQEYRRLRKALGNQRTVARMLGVALNTVSRRELGRKIIDQEAALAIKAVYRNRKSAMSELALNENLKKLFTNKGK